MDKFDEALDYPFLLTMHETLELVIEYCEGACDAEDEIALSVNLKMATMAMAAALRMYGDWSTGKVRKEELK